MKLARRPRQRQLVTLVPLVDVMTILLLFFMVTSTYLDLDMVPVAARGDAPPAERRAPAHRASGTDSTGREAHLDGGSEGRAFRSFPHSRALLRRGVVRRCVALMRCEPARRQVVRPTRSAEGLSKSLRHRLAGVTGAVGLPRQGPATAKAFDAAMGRRDHLATHNVA